jgi:hypothetical protein
MHEFPPYGELAYGATHGIPECPQRLAHVPEQYQAILGLVRIQLTHLWPRGAANVHLQEEVTRRDLAMIASMQKYWVEQPYPGVPNHSSLVLAEDSNPLANCADYLRDPNVTALTRAEVAACIRNCIGRSVLNLKADFQRIRPWQAAAILGLPQYLYHSSLTAHTPALPAGHALQGLFYTYAIYEKHRAYLDANPALRERLQQLAVDIGDRRIIGGLHYPTDNLGAWILASHLGRAVFGSDFVSFLISALQKSLLFHHMKRVGAADSMLDTLVT